MTFLLHDKISFDEQTGWIAENELTQHLKSSDTANHVTVYIGT